MEKIFIVAQIWNPAIFATLNEFGNKDIVRHAAVPHAATWSDGKAARDLRITGRLLFDRYRSYRTYIKAIFNSTSTEARTPRLSRRCSQCERVAW